MEVIKEQNQGNTGMRNIRILERNVEYYLRVAVYEGKAKKKCKLL